MRNVPKFTGLCIVVALLSIPVAHAQEGGEGEAGHMHGPDGRHIAVASTFGGQAAGQKSILSHHDLKITQADQSDAEGEGKPIEGCDVHSVIHRKGDPKAVIHREHNAYEPENGVYGSHMMYKEPGEYVIVETVTLPDKQTLTVEFPVWVPAPPGAKATVKSEAAPTSPLLLPLSGLAIVAALAVAYALGRRSGKRTVAMLTLLAVALSSLPIHLPSAFAQEAGEGEESHMHGPDGRHIAVASTFGAVQVPLKGYPSPEQKEFAVQTSGKYRFRLSIENEEMAPPDPDVVPVSASVAKTIGLAVAPATLARGGADLVTTGKVESNPNQVVTVSARVGGRIAQVGLTRGDDVRAGHAVAVIDSAEVAQAQAELRTARAQVAQSDAAVRRSGAQVAEARASVERARAEAQRERAAVSTAEATLSRQKRMAAEGAFASPSVEVARKDLTTAEGERTAAHSSLSLLEIQAQRLEQGTKDGVVARKDAEAAVTAREQGRTRLTTAERQHEIARAALAREERIQTAGLRNAREVQQAEGELAAARSALKAANAVVTSEEKRLGSVRSSVAETEAERAKAQTAVTAAQDRLRLLGAGESGGSQITITTPIGGEVESRPINAGELVQAGQPLARIFNSEVVWVESDVFEKDLPKVKIGQRVTIAADAVPGRTFQGRISYIAGAVNADTRAVRVRTVVDNRGEVLKPNMFAKVLIGAGNRSSLIVPQAAVQEDGAEQVVFLKESEDSYRRKVVQVGATMGDMVIVTSGLKDGDKVVTTGAYQLLALAKKG